MDRKIFLKRAKDLQADLEEYRRYLHMHPETGMNLYNTKKYIIEKLNDMGYVPLECGKCGIVAIAGKGSVDKCILLRADMDGLPVIEESGEVYASQEKGKMHGCGHDNHAAMLLGAARLLKEMEESVCGTVKLMFQPGEETFEGALDMIKSGVLEKPKVNAAMMIHSTTGVPMKGSMFVMDSGCKMASCDYYKILIRGKGGHGARPQDTVNPISIGAQIWMALEQIVSKELTLGTVAVISGGEFNSGSAPNVIPSEAKIVGTIRTGDKEAEEYIKKRIIQISACVSKAYRGSAKVEYSNYCPVLETDKVLSSKVTKYLEELFDNRVMSMSDAKPDEKVSGASEDFAFISSLVPSAVVMLTMGGVEGKYTYPHHHPKVCFDDSVLYMGAAAYAYAAIRWLEEEKEA